MRSHSGAGVWGGKAAFADLWNANASALAKVFPAFKNTAWDESAADQALANHLAFWTGSHGVRMERLMQRSQLKRWKWDRPGYLIGTINHACGSQKQWYKDPQRDMLVLTPPTLAIDVPAPALQPPAAPGGSELTPQLDFGQITGAFPLPHVTPGNRSSRPPVGDYLTLQQQLGLFDGCVYVQDMHEVMMPQGYTLDTKRFDAEFSGYTFAVTADGTRPAKRAWEAFVHSEVFQFPKIKGLYFDPQQPARSIMVRDGWTFLNSWVPIDIPRRQGDVTPFLNHLRCILPLGNDAEILLAYFAACVQHLGIKFQWCPLIQGVEGNGKTMLSELIEQAVGARYSHWPKASEVGSKFNAPFYGKLLVLVEDVYISEARGSLWETLKPMITGRKLEIEYKGVDKVTREVCFNLVLNTNHKNGIRKTRNDRRICPFFCAQQQESDLTRDGLTEDYFNWFRGWARDNGPTVADFLLSYQIPEKWNPAIRAIRAPKTTATEDAITAGLGAIEQEVLEVIEQGRAGFRNGWVSSTALDRLLGEMGKSATIPRNKRRELLESLGYVPHPGLKEGRSTSQDADGSRPCLYIRPGVDGGTENEGGRIMAWFQHSQR
jgi:hypothetical protein